MPHTSMPFNRAAPCPARLISFQPEADRRTYWACDVGVLELLAAESASIHNMGCLAVEEEQEDVVENNMNHSY